MGEPIEIPVVFPEAESSAEAIRALSTSVAQLATKLDTLGQKQATVKTETEKMADAAKSAADAEQRTAQQAIALGQRLQGAAMAVQSLTAQFGGQSRTAGLIGASIASSVQFAQLGLMLGPQGALVGGIIGAAIPAFALLRDEMHVATSAVAEHAASIEAMTASYVAAGEAAALQNRLASGTATIEEATASATQAQARYNDEAQRNHTLLLQQLGDRERELTSQSTLTNQVLQPQYQVMHAAAVQAVADARSELEANDALIETLRQEAEARTKVADEMEREAAAHAHLETAVRTGNDANADRSRIRRQEARRASAPSRSQREAEQSAFETTWAATLEDGENEATRRRLARIDEEFEANERLVHHKLQWQRELDEADKASQEAERERAEQGLEEHMRMLETAASAQQAHTQRVTEEANSVASNLIGSMTDVLGQLAEGNATAEESAKLMLAAFLQAMSQRAQIEALAEVARAISSYPDVAGIALHAAGALAWGAVAVATGVGAGAISGGVQRAQSARQEAERPASPRSEGVSGGSNGGTTVINFNGPVVTAQGEATMGRMLNGFSRAAERRFPGDA